MHWTEPATADDFRAAPEITFWDAGNIGKAVHEAICDPIEDTTNPYYFSVAFRLMALRGYIQAARTAVRERAPRIRFSQVANMFLPLPPRAEQDEIVCFISNNRDSTSSLETALRDSIALLKERRAALITAAVTGRLAISA
jgi:type I restriction enzyme S subunit